MTEDSFRDILDRWRATSKTPEHPVSRSMTDPQGSTKGPSGIQPRGSSLGIVTKTLRPWEKLSSEEAVRARVLDLLHRDPGGRRYRPWAWHELQTGVGGVVRKADLRQVIDQLLNNGLVVELWLEPRTRRGLPGHKLVLVERWHEYAINRNSVLRARGRDSTLRRLGL